MDDLSGTSSACGATGARARRRARVTSAGTDLLLGLLLGVVVVWAPIVTPGRAQAAATEAERLEALRDLKEGNRLFEAGDYMAALARFESAYGKVPSPKLFFNFGQVHRRLGRTVEALEFYERFLAETPGAPAKLRAEAQQWIADLERRG